jgi:hypothetical protein
MPDGNLFVEKRAHPRVSVKIPVKYRVVEDLAGIQSIIEMRKSETNTQTLDLSLGGMYIVSNQPLGVGNILHLDITLTGKEKRLTAFGEVVWSKDSGAGLHFMMIKHEDLEALQAFLGESSPKK